MSIQYIWLTQYYELGLFRCLETTIKDTIVRYHRGHQDVSCVQVRLSNMFYPTEND